jgi:ribonuclease VapC
MFIDASALMALLADEDRARELLERRQPTGTRLTSPLAFWQATIAVARVLDLPIPEATETMYVYLVLMPITMAPMPPETARIALDVFDRYSKGAIRLSSISGTASPMPAPGISAIPRCPSGPISRRPTSGPPELT